MIRFVALEPEITFYKKYENLGWKFNQIFISIFINYKLNTHVAVLILTEDPQTYE